MKRLTSKEVMQISEYDLKHKYFLADSGQFGLLKPVILQIRNKKRFAICSIGNFRNEFPISKVINSLSDMLKAFTYNDIGESCLYEFETNQEYVEFIFSKLSNKKMYTLHEVGSSY